VSQYKDGHFAAVPLRANWSGRKIYAITADDAGDVWLLNEAGELARVRDGKVLSPAAGAVAKVVSLARGQDGTVWIERAGVVSALKAGRLTVEVSTNDYVQGICAARGGGLWVACNSRIQKWKDGKWVADLGGAPWGWNIVANLTETSAGVLAGGTSGDGLWLFFTAQTNAPALHFTSTNGLPSDWVISLWEDREKKIYGAAPEPDWSSSVRIILKSFPRRTTGKAGLCSRCCPHRTAHCGSAPKARDCIVC